MQMLNRTVRTRLTAARAYLRIALSPLSRLPLPSFSGRQLHRLTELSSRHAYLVVGIWIAIAGCLNIVVPQLEHIVAEQSGPFIPESSPSLATLSRVSPEFGESPQTAIGYLVFENPTGITNADRQTYTDILNEIRHNTAQVASVMDLLDSPGAAATATSQDGQAIYAVVNFFGGMGSAAALEGQDFVTSVISQRSAGSDMHIYLTGPAPSIGDELETEDRIVAVITGLSVIMIITLLLLVYRSVTTIIVPLATVGLALAVARPVVGLLAMHAGLEVSIFSVILLAALILGGGTDYAIFMLSGYHEGRRRQLPWNEAILNASKRTSGVIVASGLTVAAGCAVMSLTKVVLFRTAGLACAVGVLLAVAATLTLVPALMSILGRRGLLEPKRQRMLRQWRNHGIRVVKRPGVMLVGSLAVLLVLAIQVPKMSTGYDEREMQPTSTSSNEGYAAVARHFDPNELTPDIIVIDSDHDLRNSADFSALNAVSRSIQEVSGVQEVRSVTQPEGRLIPEFSLAQQDRILADQIGAAMKALTDSQPELHRLTDGITQLDDGIGRISDGSSLAATGSGQATSGEAQLNVGLREASDGSGQLLSGANQLAAGSLELANGIEAAVDPILSFLGGGNSDDLCPPTGDCDVNQQMERLAQLAQDHSLVGQLRYLKDGSRVLASGNRELADGAQQLQDGLQRAVNGSDSIHSGQQLLTTKLKELADGAAAAKTGTDQISNGVNQFLPQMKTLVDGMSQARSYLDEVATNVGDGPDAGFYVPKVAFSDPQLAEAMKFFISSDGRTARMLVINSASAYSPGAIDHLNTVMTTAQTALERTSLAGSRVEATGLAAGFRDLHQLVLRDFAVIAICVLAFIFIILIGLLRSLIAPLYILATITLSYLSALGLTVLVWQELFGIDIYWAVPPIAFVALLAVGSDYNMMFMSRLRHESGMGISTGIVRTFKTTGDVVSTAGVIFALTMLAMLASPTHSIGQVGFTIGAGLLLDTFVVRAITVPAIAKLLGSRNWWPRHLSVSRRPSPTSSSAPTPTASPLSGYAGPVST